MISSRAMLGAIAVGVAAAAGCMALVALLVLLWPAEMIIEARAVLIVVLVALAVGLTSAYLWARRDLRRS
jgi:hypothetical protein